MKRFILALAALAFVTAAPAFAQSPFSDDPSKVQAGSYTLDKNHGKITWSVSHLGFSTYYGQFADVAATLSLDPAKPEAASLDVTVQTSSVGTLNSALDEHLKSPMFFDVAKFPTATFKSTKVKLTGPKTAKVKGLLTLHGVTKPVTLSVIFNEAGANPIDKQYSVGFDAKAVIKRSEFGITTFVPFVSDDVPLLIEGEFKLNK